MNKSYITLALIMLLLTVSASPTTTQEAATYYITEGESIQDAIDNAAPGDTIVIGPGEYIVDDLFMAKSLTLQGSGAEDTILYGSIHLWQPPAADGQPQGSQYRIISDMTIDNINKQDAYSFDPAITTYNLSQTAEAGPDGGSYLLSEVKVTDCVIRSETGIYILGAETVEIASTQLYGFWMYHVVISADELDGNGYPEDNGIYASNCDAVSVSSSSIMGYYANGIEITSCSNVRIVNNIITGCDMAGVNLDAASVILTNNTLVENRVAIDIDAETAAVANNIAVISSRPSAFDSLTSDIDISTDDELYFVNNDIYKFRLFVCTPVDGASSWGFPIGYIIDLYSVAGLEYVSDNIFENPQLEMYMWYSTLPLASESDLDSALIVLGFETFDPYKIQQTSPCKDAGINAAQDTYGNVHDDIFGTSRPQSGRYDIGAHELTTYAPASMQPLVMTALGNATQSWNAILGSLPDTLSGEQQALLDAIQAFMEQAKALGNPIAANGALQQALAQMDALMATL